MCPESMWQAAWMPMTDHKPAAMSVIDTPTRDMPVVDAPTIDMPVVDAPVVDAAGTGALGAAADGPVLASTMSFSTGG